MSRSKKKPTRREREELRRRPDIIDPEEQLALEQELWGYFPEMVLKSKGTKPPRRRIQPGSFVVLDSKLYQVLMMYRRADEPNEWRYILEKRASIDEVYEDQNPHLHEDPVFDDEDWWFERQIPQHSDRRWETNKVMVQRAEVISSGGIVRSLTTDIAPKD
jgi:hypothetical protein